jgi:hypothetical protein
MFMFCTSGPTTENFSRELKNFSNRRPRGQGASAHYWDIETRYLGQNVNMRLREVPPAHSIGFRDNSPDRPESGKPDSHPIRRAPTNYLFRVAPPTPLTPGFILDNV